MIYKRKYAFAGISNQRQATAALGIRLCTAEVGDSNPSTSPLKYFVLQEKREAKMSDPNASQAP